MTGQGRNIKHRPKVTMTICMWGKKPRQVKEEPERSEGSYEK